MKKIISTITTKDIELIEAEEPQDDKYNYLKLKDIIEFNSNESE